MRVNWMLGLMAMVVVAGCGSDDSSGTNTTKTTCQKICDCECGSNGTCLSDCNNSCKTYTEMCQNCIIGVGCSQLYGVQGVPAQCNSVCGK